MREILHAELLVGASVPAEARGPSEVRGRMELEHDEALRERSPLAVMRIAVDSLEQIAAIASGGRVENVLSSVASILRSLPRAGNLLALREQDQVVAVFARTDPVAAEILARAMQENARLLTTSRTPAPLGIRLSIGLAYAQFDEPYWFQTLLAVAQEGVEVARSSGGGRIVHSELYSFHQRRLERLSPDRKKPALPAVPLHAEPQFAPPSAPLPSAMPVRQGSHEARPAPAMLATGVGLHELEERVLTLAREWTEEALAGALAETKKVHSSEIETLERRIAKLSRALEEAQADLVRSHGAASIDPGVASAYRTVQGLKDERGSGVKREMLERLFEANLELRTLLGRQG